MKSSIFDYLDYKKFLRDWLKSSPKAGRGLKSKWAELMRCRPGYVSQVLEGAAHFSLEQVAALAPNLALSEEEEQFLYQLVNYTRAGSEQLKRKLRQAIDRKIAERQILKNRLKAAASISKEEEARYYSTWAYAFTHALVSVPAFQSKQAIADRLKLPLQKVTEILGFLTGAGIIVQTGDEFKVGNRLVYIGNDSPLIVRHHTNWRLEALKSLDHESVQDLHFSAAFSCSRADYQKIREALLQTLEQFKATVSQSADEDAFAICLDLFSPR